jgi:hypothetical protein
MDLTNQKIEEIFSLLESEGLISPIKIVNNEADRLPYKIADVSLYYLLDDHLRLAMHIRLKLILIWSKIRRPTTEEAEWFEFFFTKKDYYTTFGFTTEERQKIHKKTKRKRTFESIREELTIVEQRIADHMRRIREMHANTIKKYHFPVDRLIEKIYPKSLQKSPFAS